METENKENSEPSSQVIEIKGRKFDLSTPEGRAQLQLWGELMSENVGSLAQKKGDLEQEVKQLKKYALRPETKDISEIKALAKKMRDEGREEEEIDLFYENALKEIHHSASKGSEFELMWRDYAAQRPEVLKGLTKLEQDMYKNHIRQNYLDQLEAAGERQFTLLDQIFEDRIRSAKPAVEDSDSVPAVLQAGSKAPKVDKKEEKNPEADADAKISSIFSELGFN